MPTSYNRHIMPRRLFLLGEGLLLLLISLFFYSNDGFTFHGVMISRQGDPVKFWSVVVFSAAWGVFVLFDAVRLRKR